MNRWIASSLLAGIVAAVTPVTGESQQLRSLVPARREQPPEIPREHLPPRGMCRVWIDGVPPDKQPAPTDCATAVKNKPRNARVVFGKDTKDTAEGKTEKPRKP